jgi:hypothetical protein
LTDDHDTHAPQPYVADDAVVPEFTAKAVVIGAFFGILFGASTVYLALKAGLTVSASIPIAVLSISLLKKLGGSTILENNIVQTIGSAGESVAPCRGSCSWLTTPRRAAASASRTSTTPQSSCSRCWAASSAS